MFNYLLVLLCIFVFALMIITLVCIGKIAWRYTIKYCNDKNISNKWED
jgi:hypothetical protein